MQYYPYELLPAQILFAPQNAEFFPENRRWQGIASIEHTRKGRLLTVFFSGMETEENGNFIVICKSDDDGCTWLDPWMIVKHPDAEMRVFDSILWMDPLGRLWLFWTQSHNYYDGIHGVWCIRCDDPDADVPIFSSPRRIANGNMNCKPTVLSSGEWLFPIALWSPSAWEPEEKHPEADGERFSNVYLSTDYGENFKRVGYADVPNRHFDEHMIVEKQDGSLWMIVRRYDGIGQAFSYDKGRTWLQAGHSGIPNPDTRVFLRRLISGNLLLVYHVDFHGRNHLYAKLSCDDGVTWTGGLMLDERNEVSYPDGMQDKNGYIYIAYDHERFDAREILMAKFTEQDILAGMPVNPNTRMKCLISQAHGVHSTHR